MDNNVDRKNNNSNNLDNSSEVFDEEQEKVINNEYDYSNKIANIESISYLVQYCERVYNWFLALITEDEKRNEKLKMEYQNFNYKKAYSNTFEIKIRKKDNYNYTAFKSYISFKDAALNGQVNNLGALKIELNLDCRRGKNYSLKEYQNSFEISFEPYNIKFIRKANHNEQNMQQIEDNINKLLNNFTTVNTIFSTK